MRQTVLKGFGVAAQSKLSASRVLVVGLGGLGLPVVQYLNAMGIGTLGLVEQDIVEYTNLQRQVLYTEKDINRPKIEVAYEFLKAQNSESRLELYDEFLSRDNALEIIRKYDLVIDATDNFPTRYLINDSCVILKKPFVYGALHGFEGQVSVFNLDGGPTYRCIYPVMPGPQEIRDCNQNGVLGVIPGIIGNLQALEAVKVLTGIGEVLSGQLLIYNGLDQTFQKMRFPPRRENLELTKLAEHYLVPGCLTGPEVSMEKLISMAKNAGNLKIVDVRDTQEFTSFHIHGSINIPLRVLGEAAADFEPGQSIYFLCATGKRSRIAQQMMMENYPELTVYNVEGGIQNYKAIAHE
jgi:adenylyltransferase/sulfurtransferase